MEHLLKAEKSTKNALKIILIVGATSAAAQIVVRLCRRPPLFSSALTCQDPHHPHRRYCSVHFFAQHHHRRPMCGHCFSIKSQEYMIPSHP